MLLGFDGMVVALRDVNFVIFLIDSNKYPIQYDFFTNQYLVEDIGEIRNNYIITSSSLN